MGAENFVDFIISYFVEQALMVFERIVMDPGLKYIAKLWPKWRMMLKRRFAKKRHMTREQRAREEAEWKRINEEIALESEGVEPLIDSFAVYANETVAMLMGPFVLIYLLNFLNETQIPIMYNIKERELNFYIYFAIICVPFTLVADVFLHMTQELYHGWKVYDFVAYQKYRFSVRENRWQMEAWDTLDESIAEPLQTVDMMCFSSQFYFMASIHGAGILLTMFGMTITLRQRSNPFADQMLPVIIVGMWGFVTCINWMCRCFANIVGIWDRKSLQGTVDDEIAAKLAIGEGRQEDLEAERLELQAMNSERFRHRFLDRSRPWVLQHLVELLTPRTLQMPGADGRPVIEYIRDVYTDLMNLAEGRRRPGDREDISSDEGDDEMLAQRRNWSKAPLSKSSAAILRKWLEHARRRRTLLKLVKGTIERATADTCALCGRTASSGARMRCDLAVDGKADDSAIDVLIEGFQKDYPGRKFEPNLWTAYFRSHASFITRCHHCIDRLEAARADKIKRHPGAGRATLAMDMSSDDEDDEDDVVFEPMVITRSSIEGKLMSKWLNAVRRRLGGAFPRPHAREEMEAYAKKMRDFKLKKAKADMRAKGYISDDEDEDGNVILKVGEISAATKALAKHWLIKARSSLVEEKRKRMSRIKEDLRVMTSAITEDDDWYYGSELQLSGLALAEEGRKLDESRRTLEGDARAAERELRSKLEKFKEEKEIQMQAEIEAVEASMKAARVKALEAAEGRIQELTRDRTRKEALFKKEEKLAAPEDRGMLAAQHKKELKKFDDAIQKEREKQASALEKAMDVGKEDLGKKQAKRDQALHDREEMTEKKVKDLHEDVEQKMKDKERNWQNRVSGWLNKADRKVKMKAEEDKAKAANEAERKRRRKLRK